MSSQRALKQPPEQNFALRCRRTPSILIGPRPRPSAGRSLVADSAGAGRLGGDGNSQEAARRQLLLDHLEKVETFKTKEAEKRLKKLEEKIKRYPYLHTAPGNTLSNEVDEGLEEARNRQQNHYDVTYKDIGADKLKQQLLKEEERKLNKLKAKVERYSFLDTSQGNQLCSRQNIDTLRSAPASKLIPSQGGSQPPSMNEQGCGPELTLQEVRLAQQKKYNERMLK